MKEQQKKNGWYRISLFRSHAASGNPTPGSFIWPLVQAHMVAVQNRAGGIFGSCVIYPFSTRTCGGVYHQQSSAIWPDLGSDDPYCLHSLDHGGGAGMALKGLRQGLQVIICDAICMKINICMLVHSRYFSRIHDEIRAVAKTWKSSGIFCSASVWWQFHRCNALTEKWSFPQIANPLSFPCAERSLSAWHLFFSRQHFGYYWRSDHDAALVRNY